MNFALVKQGVNHAITHLVEVTQVNNIELVDISRCVSWKGYKPGIQKNIYYSLEYQYLLDNQQYSLLLRDGSFFQFFFNFKSSNELHAARLAYYPRPVKTLDLSDDLLVAANSALERDDDDLYDHLFNWVELLETDIGNPANTSHLRFDFDDTVTSHCKSHLQFGAVQEFRIPADFFPLPMAFIEMCGSLVSGFSQISLAHLGFARNNKLRLQRRNELISLT
jgi:hypothetical protein